MWHMAYLLHFSYNFNPKKSAFPDWLKTPVSAELGEAAAHISV